MVITGKRPDEKYQFWDLPENIDTENDFKLTAENI